MKFKNVMRPFSFYTSMGLLLIAATLKGEPQGPCRSTLEAIEQAHAALWSSRIDTNGVILDYVGEIPTPEDCALGRPNAIGWWSPIENGPMFTGLYLPAACERARRSGAPDDKGQARRLMQGLLRCASVSDVPGFIARGMGSDGKCHYPLGSDDQTHPWFYGLHAYFTSGLASDGERSQIAAKMKEVAEVLEASSWQCPCDGAFRGQFRGAYQGHLFRDAARYLFMLRAMYDVTQDRVWLERYRKALAARPMKSDLMRAQICSAGYGLDREEIKTDNSLWIYVGSQGSLAKLVAMESDETLRAQYREGLSANFKNARAPIEAFKEFDNADTKVFGHVNWREGYSTWFPQATQADAAKLAETGDKAKLGRRKSYEAQYMRNPLAAAAIIALSGGDQTQTRDVVERAIRHYDYSKLNMSEFFFAECAYYALGLKGPTRGGRD